MKKGRAGETSSGCASGASSSCRFLHLLPPGPGPGLLQQVTRCVDTDVASEQHRLELLEQRFVDLATTAEYRGKLRSET
jgi:hypothetical protein